MSDTLLILLDGSNYAWRDGEWVQVQPPTSPPQEGMITISDVCVSPTPTPADAPLADILRRLIPAAESADLVCESEGTGPPDLPAILAEAKSALAAYDADAPVLSPSETDEEEPKSVPFTPTPWEIHPQSATTVTKGNRSIASCGGYSTNQENWEEVQNENQGNAQRIVHCVNTYAQAVEAAYMEGWEKKHDFFSATSDWVRSEAKKKLEGMK